jgi:diacylglycerol kinase (ATP)
VGVYLIVNPVSGGGRGARSLGAVTSALERRFGTVIVHQTARPGDATLLARMAAEAECELVVAMGGDGTISECVSGILSSTRPDMPLAIVPSGTGSDFASNFGANASCEAWVERITWPQSREIDAGEIRLNGALANELPRYFNNIVSMGVSGLIAARINRARRLPFVPGKALFFIHSLIALIRYRPVVMRFVIDGRDAGIFPVTLAVAANGPRFGAGMLVAPMARMDDGMMEIIIIPGLPKWRILLEFSRIYAGTHLKNPNVLHVRAKCFSAERVADGNRDMLDVEIDGEPVSCRMIHFEMRPSSLIMAI